MTDADGPFVVVGGDAAGLSAASKCVREDPDRTVVVFERGQWVSYAHCGLPYYVKGEVDRLTDLVTLTPDDVADRGIDLRRGHEVTAVDTGAETVTVEAGGEEYEQPYGALLIATGASARTAPVDGAALDGAFTIHGLDAAGALRAFLRPPAEVNPEAVDGDAVDRERVRRYADRKPPDSAVIVGGGYVGVEMAEALAAWDLDVTLLQRADRLLPPFGAAVADRVQAHLEDRGVTVRTGVEVDHLRGDDHVTGVVAGGETLSTRLAVVGVGIEPNTAPVAATDVTLGASGAIATDRHGQTSVSGVYAAGDCAEARHTVTGDPVWVPLGLTANRAGRAIGATVAGEPTPVGDVAGTAVLKAFDLGCGRTGLLDAERAREAGLDPVAETVTAGSRSGYYPGAADTTVTLVADRSTGRVLGASTVGTDRAAKRIDTVATALDADMTVGELQRLDLGYAPPFSPVWDPVLVAAKVLGGSVDGDQAGERGGDREAAGGARDANDDPTASG
ncbi:MAG: FAD-dependent oxidoreductase [Halobacteriaceae archaeon]